MLSVGIWRSFSLCSSVRTQQTQQKCTQHLPTICCFYSLTQKWNLPRLNLSDQWSQLGCHLGHPRHGCQPRSRPFKLWHCPLWPCHCCPPAGRALSSCCHGRSWAAPSCVTAASSPCAAVTPTCSPCSAPPALVHSCSHHMCPVPRVPCPGCSGCAEVALRLHTRCSLFSLVAWALLSVYFCLSFSLIILLVQHFKCINQNNVKGFLLQYVCQQ